MKTTKKGMHRHHIIPKHMGGTDDDDNIIYLTPKEHAQAHLLLYEKYGKTQDYVAAQCCLGLMTESEAKRKLMSEGGKKGGLVTSNVNKTTSGRQRISVGLKKSEAFKSYNEKRKKENEEFRQSVLKMFSRKENKLISECKELNAGKRGGQCSPIGVFSKRYKDILGVSEKTLRLWLNKECVKDK